MQTERRKIASRRNEDLTDFTQCLRFDRHEISEEQVIEIARKAVEIAKKEAVQEVGEYVIEVGKGFATKLFFLIGAVLITLFAWASRHGFHF